MTGDANGWDAQVTFCYGKEFEAAVHFYEELLGLPLALDQGACRIYRVRDGAFIGICRRDKPPASDGIILTLVTDDVDGWRMLGRSYMSVQRFGDAAQAFRRVVNLSAGDTADHIDYAEARVMTDQEGITGPIGEHGVDEPASTERFEEQLETLHHDPAVVAGGTASLIEAISDAVPPETTVGS